MNARKRLIIFIALLFTFCLGIIIVALNKNGIVGQSQEAVSHDVEIQSDAKNMAQGLMDNQDPIENQKEQTLGEGQVMESSDSVMIPILTYHHIDTDETKSGRSIVTPDKFRSDMEYLKEAGYNTLLFEDLVDYVDKGTKLPDKPLVITFDDGYLSNYEYAYPVLQELGMKATISIIGISVGKDTYKDTDTSIIPHFSYEQAKEMYDSGVIDIQCHTYSMHDSAALETDYRQGVLMKENESEDTYIEVFNDDYSQLKQVMEAEVGNEMFVFTYPLGLYTELSESLLLELGNRVSLTTEPGVNWVTKQSEESLLAMKRINVGGDVSGEGIVELIDSYSTKGTDGN